MICAIGYGKSGAERWNGGDGAAAAISRIVGRVLVPGGALYISVPAYQSLWSGHDIALMHQRHIGTHGNNAIRTAALYADTCGQHR